jgi:hypothetical protein
MSNLQPLNAFLSGAIAMAFGAIGLCFLRFWRRSRIRLFNHFAIAFFLLSVERIVLVLISPEYKETAHYVYFIRLTAFMLIIAGIVQHNRSSPK